MEIVIYSLHRTGYGFRIAGPHGVMQVMDAEACAQIYRWIGEAERMGETDCKKYVEYKINENW